MSEHEPLRVPADDVVRHPVDRRVFLRWAGRTSLAGMALLGAWGGLSGCGDDDSDRTGRTTGTGTGDGEGDGGTLPPTLKIGVIAPMEGLGKFIGDIVDHSLRSAMEHIEREGLVKGTKVSYEIVNAKAEELADATGKAYAQLVADPDVVGILWCSPVGLPESRAQIARDGIPVISVFYDAWSEDWLYPDGPERSVFQLLMPDSMAMDVLMRYAKEDRGYASAGLFYDSSIGEVYRTGFERAIDKHGLSVAGVEQFNIFSADYGAQLQRLGDQGSHCLFVWGLAENTAGIVQGLDAIGASYVDTPTARGSQWRPHVLGSPGGTGEKKWAELAGDAAKTGTLTAWHMGGLIGLPSLPIRTWMQDYLGVPATGGEESPANGLWALVEAVRRAGTTDRRAVVTALEGLTTTFAGLEYGFEPDRHLAITEDQVVLVSLERYTGPAETDPPYQLGREWEEVWLPAFPDYVGPTHLVRPTLEANRRAFPDTVTEILEGGWGTLCTVDPPDATGEDIELSNDCKIH